ncbi:MAG: hypothetical protein PHQ43_07400 [Dehalococcoidales bacterium]|nr:hypothetical protein [Dehalococcoidales bacterium]
MADSGGHWKTLAEAQKLTQSMKIPGVFEEDVKRANPLDRISMAQAAGTGLKIEWLREKTTVEDAVVETDIGDQLTWSEDVEYDEKESTLRRVYVQRKLDHYVEGIYGTYNNYEARMLLECEKGLRRKIGDRLIYADTTYDGTPTRFDGYHALAAEHGTAYTTSALGNDPKNIDQAHAGLSLHYLRVMVDSMLHGCDEILAPFEIIRWLDAAYQEKGFAGLAYNVAGNLGFLTQGFNDIGKRVLFWDGIPITRTDYLVAEQVDTGTGASSDARAKYTSGTRYYSIFGVKYGNGQLDGSNPGLVFAFGKTQGVGDLYKLVRFPELEDYDAGGIRLVTYGAPILPSTHCLARIWDIGDAAVTV